MSRFRSGLVAFALLAQNGFVATLPGQQAACPDTLTIARCYSSLVTRLTAKKNDSSAKAADSSTKAGTAAKPTGNGASLTPERTAIKDFLPTIATAVSIPGLASDPTGLGLRLNLGRNNQLLRGPYTLQLEAVANQGTPYDTLLGLASKGRQPVLKDSLTKTIGLFDDVTSSLSFNVETRGLGRAFFQHEAAISAAIEGLLKSSAGETQANTLFRAIVLTAERDPVRSPDKACRAELAESDLPLRCLKGDQTKLVDTLGALAKMVAASESRARDSLTYYGFDRLEDLINNQPQLSVTAQRRVRRSIVGPDQATFEVRYEYSPSTSFSAAETSCGGELTARCLKSFVDAAGPALKAGGRWWAALDGSRTDSYKALLPGDALQLTRGVSSAVELATGYGQYVTITGQQLRLDGELRGRVSDNQSIRQNRLTAALMVTQKVSDQSNSVLTLVWANRPEFVGTVDHHVTANIGLSFKTSAGTN